VIPSVLAKGAIERQQFGCSGHRVGVVRGVEKSHRANRRIAVIEGGCNFITADIGSTRPLWPSPRQNLRDMNI